MGPVPPRQLPPLLHVAFSTYTGPHKPAPLGNEEPRLSLRFNLRVNWQAVSADVQSDSKKTEGLPGPNNLFNCIYLFKELKGGAQQYKCT